jgi:GNAT superfamily N-acetyltransferase
VSRDEQPADPTTGHGTAGLTVRPFRPADRDQLLALNAYGLAAAGITVGDDYYAGQDLADLSATYAQGVGGVMLVGQVDGVIVAMGGIRRVDSTTCELLRMRVYPRYQGRGYGSRLLRLLEREAGSLGYRRIELVTGQDQHPAIDLYSRRGYRIIRREVLIGIPSVRMAKDVDKAMRSDARVDQD